MTNEQALDKLDKTVTGDLEWKIVVTKALEKQIPKKFARKEEFMAKNRCPECNAVLLFATLQLHCGKCGQAIDWSEEE